MSLPARDARSVSFDSEPLILVDEHDREVGHLSKADAHRGRGVLHRAFSIFLFDRAGRVLLQQRGADKPLWPLYWSNSCCSHPRRGETMPEATARRMREELGLVCPLEFRYKFIYRADFGDAGAEHELCWVYTGQIDQQVHPHPQEIAQWRFSDPDAVDRELAEAPDRFTPWFCLEWRRLRDESGIQPSAKGRDVKQKNDQ